MQAKAEIDITITGVLGFYTISGTSDEGASWIDEFVQGGRNGVAYSDDGECTRNITQKAFDDGLRVVVDGAEFFGPS